MTYELTAATFGVTEPNKILYRLDEDFIEIGSEDFMASLNKPQEYQNVWTYIQGFLSAKVPEAKIRGKSVNDALNILIKEYKLPIVLTPTAQKVLENNEKTIEFDFDGISVDSLLAYVLKDYPGLGIIKRNFSFLVYDKVNDVPDQIVTIILQHDPFISFPDDIKVSTNKEITEATKNLIEFMGITKFPKNWFVYCDRGLDLEIITASPQIALRLYDIYRIPDAGVYYGRIDPLLKCLRGYPLAGQVGQRYTAEWAPYIQRASNQVDRVHNFLNDRLAKILLLQARLEKIEEHATNRYRPFIGIEGVTDLGERLGLWFDGKSYRFLVFDSKKDRDRWLKGEDWFDKIQNLENSLEKEKGIIESLHQKAEKEKKKAEEERKVKNPE